MGKVREACERISGLSSSAPASPYKPPTAFKASPKVPPQTPKSHHKTLTRDYMDARRMVFEEGVRREVGFDVDRV
jgi:hypothetical protein